MYQHLCMHCMSIEKISKGNQKCPKMVAKHKKDGQNILRMPQK